MLAPNLCPNEITLLTQDAQNKARFLIDRLWSRLLFEPRGLVVLNGLVGNIDHHQAAQQAFDMTQSVFRKRGGARMAQLIGRLELPRDLGQGADTVLPVIFDLVEPLLQFEPPLLLG